MVYFILLWEKGGNVNVLIIKILNPPFPQKIKRHKKVIIMQYAIIRIINNFILNKYIYINIHNKLFLYFLKVKMSLSIKFIQGLEKHGLSYNEIKKWQYCGGKSWSDGAYEITRHEKYFKQCYPNEDYPKQKKECICGTDLIHNCFIRENNESSVESILIVGQCCVEKFIDGGLDKRCEKCSSPHNNIKDNLCKICRKRQHNAEQLEKAKQRNLETALRREQKRIEKEKEKERLLHSQRYYFDIPYDISNDKENYAYLKTNKCKWESTIKAWYCNGNKNNIENILDHFEEYHIEDIEDFKQKKNTKFKEYKDKNFINDIMKDLKLSFMDAVANAKGKNLRFDKELKLWYKQY